MSGNGPTSIHGFIMDNSIMDASAVREVSRRRTCQSLERHVVNRHNLFERWLRRYRAEHVLWPRHCSQYGYYGGRLYRPAGGGRVQEARVDAGRKTRAQLHDGHAADEKAEKCGS
uniref:(northern house mosquito) hypothetical protein n=1 Tax=Culex pipiens TaxID=7175 RepID=A0A8D8F5C6_CULPI